MTDNSFNKAISKSIYDKEVKYILDVLRLYTDNFQPVEEIDLEILDLLAVRGFIMYSLNKDCYSITVYGINAIEKTR